MILTTILVVVGLCFGGVVADSDSKLCEARNFGASWSYMDNEAVNDAPMFRSIVRTPAAVRDFPEQPP